MDLEENKFIKHFSHHHSLLLKREQLDDGTDVSCYGCLQPIKGPSYGCKRCLFFLHISCAALPEDITHPYHPQHPLSLLPNPPDRYTECLCDICGKEWNRFIYHCSECNFDVDIKCASMVVHIQKKIKHESHPQHELIPLQKLITFLCDACGTQHMRDTSYLCTTCGFWISQKCAVLPTTIQLIPHHHHHPLTLIYSVPYKSDITCGICDKEVCRRNWVYWCSESECEYIVHVNNAIKSDMEEPSTLRDCKALTAVHDPSQISLFIDSDTSDIRTTNFNNEAEITDEETVPLQLPLLDHESIDLTITKFIKDMVGKVVTTNRSTDHHEHTLIFCNEQIDPDEKCDGCGLSINTINSTTFYRCVKCNDFFLHECCAKLPNEIQHPCHPKHPLVLITGGQYSSYFCRCHCCQSNIFYYFRFGCLHCDFYLDIKCASLLHTIKHKAHNHVLALRNTWRHPCSACNSEFPCFGFVCDPCSLEICVRCALLPGTVESKYDRHLFYLRYSPCRESDDDVDLCEICEEDLDSKLWFYHCCICDKSLHTHCVFRVHPFLNWRLIQMIGLSGGNYN